MPAEVSEVLCSSWAEYDDVPQSMLDTLPEGVTQAEVEAALLRASETLWALSGRRWYGGGCEETVTLRSSPPLPGSGSWPYESSWRNCRCWSYGGNLDALPFKLAGFSGRHVEAPIAVRLPRSPAQVNEVTIDGQVFAGYRVTRSGWLERTDGRSWGVCSGDTEVTYTFGTPPPAGGRDAAIELGLELVRAQIGDAACRLPERVTSVTRQGVSFTIEPTDYMDAGRTGLVGVDSWLRVVNPHRVVQEATIWSPDLPQTMRS